MARKSAQTKAGGAKPAKMDAAALRLAILGAQDLPSERVHVPEWGLQVYVRTLTAAERDELDFSLSRAAKDMPQVERDRLFTARYVAALLVDAEGQRLFSEADAAELAGKSGAALERILSVGARLNRLFGPQAEAARGN